MLDVTTATRQPATPSVPVTTVTRQTADQYDAAFQTFFTRFDAPRVIDQSNTLFVFSAEENDQFDGANVGRAIQPMPTGAAPNTSCVRFSHPSMYCYTAGQIGEINTNLPGLLAAQKGNTTPFTVRTAGRRDLRHRPARPDRPRRPPQLERDIGSLTNPHDPYTGNDDEPIAAYLAGSVEQEILHLINADPDRTPTFTLFPKPERLSLARPSRARRPFRRRAPRTRWADAARFAWDHGYYAPTIDVTWVGFVGPGRRQHRSGRTRGRPTGRQSTIRMEAGLSRSSAPNGTWVDLPDIRPTLLWLAGSRTATSTTVAC